MKVGHTGFITILEKDKEALLKYWQWLSKTYTDENSAVKYCPQLPWCGYFTERDRTTPKFAVSCKCGNSFCFACERPAHRPCDCELAKKWMDKADTESENIAYIKANSRACPICHTATEKISGCN